jgi:hypothetical protein
MAFARERLLRLFPQCAAPAVQHPFWDPQVAGDLGHGLLAALTQAHRFQLEVAGVDPLVQLLVWFLLFCGHGSCPFRLRGV